MCSTRLSDYTYLLSDLLYRDGMIHCILFEWHKHCFLTHRKRLVELQNLKEIAHGPFSSHRNALWVHTYLRLSTREVGHMQISNFHYHNNILVRLQKKDPAPPSLVGEKLFILYLRLSEVCIVNKQSFFLHHTF